MPPISIKNGVVLNFDYFGITSMVILVKHDAF